MFCRGIIGGHCFAQDEATQRRLILDHVQRKGLFLSDVVVLQNANKKHFLREIMALFGEDEMCLVSDILALGGSLVRILEVIHALNQHGVKVISAGQPALSKVQTSPSYHGVVSEILDVQQSIISYRTQLGLQATKQKGVKLGRPKGVKNKTRALDDYREDILRYLNEGVSVNKILTLVNEASDKQLAYSSIRYFIENDEALKKARANFNDGSLLR